MFKKEEIRLKTTYATEIKIEFVQQNRSAILCVIDKLDFALFFVVVIFATGMQLSGICIFLCIDC